MEQQFEGGTVTNGHGVHIVGIGRTGAAYVEALLRTGEIEDSLVKPGSSFAALLLDIGEDDMFVPSDYARSLRKRLASRSIPADRYHYESFVFNMPEIKEFSRELEETRLIFKAKNGHDLLKLPADFKLPGPGEHTPRAIAKALAAIKSYNGDKPVAAALRRFSDQVKKTGYPSTVLVVFGMAGGTGSGMALDLARALRRLLPSESKVVGVGQLSHSGDGDYYNSLSQTLAIEEVESAQKVNPESVPFPDGFFIVSPEHSWQRLTAYTSTGVKEVRQRFKQMVTNRFVADSFVRWVVANDSTHLTRVIHRGAGKFVLFDVAKLTHPGVQVLPGESSTRWHSVLQQWIDFTPKYAGLTNGFKTDYSEVHIYSARDMAIDMIAAEMKKVVSTAYLNDKSADVPTFKTEFFDALTSYANVIITGVTKDDLSSYKESKEAQSKIKTASKSLEVADVPG